jgi:hypothetical protein
MGNQKSERPKPERHVVVVGELREQPDLKKLVRALMSHVQAQPDIEAPGPPKAVGQGKRAPKQARRP